MRHFDEIFRIAADRHGGAEALETKLSVPLSPDALAQIPDDRWLSQMAKNIFRAGFNWQVVETKWPGFETAFEGFEPARVVHYRDDDMDRLLRDKSIIRNGMKIAAVLENAAFVSAVAETHGGFGAWVAQNPVTEHNILVQEISKRGARLGAATGQRFLRYSGRDSYVMSQDVVARLVAEGVLHGKPNSQRAMAAVQNAFNTWMTQSGRGLTQISQTLAFSL